MNTIELKNVYKIFGANEKQALEMISQGRSKEDILTQTQCTVGVNNVSLSIGKGEFFVLMGLSGSGKSTLIRHLNRLIDPSKGQVIIGGENILDYDEKNLLEFRRKKISMVFQRFGLFPHKSILDNVAYGLKIREENAGEIEKQCQYWIEKVGLKGYQDQRPRQLSGGMQQRVGIARALVTNTDILLMDEPFSALDPIIRNEMQEVMLKLQKETKKTTVFVTHDLEEAFKLADRMAILNDGEVVQVGTPTEIKANPANDYVKTFMNML